VIAAERIDLNGSDATHTGSFHGDTPSFGLTIGFVKPLNCFAKMTGVFGDDAAGEFEIAITEDGLRERFLFPGDQSSGDRLFIGNNRRPAEKSIRQIFPPVQGESAISNDTAEIITRI